MNTAFRIVPRLDIKSPNLVKGIRLEGLRVVGDPSEYARRYYSEGADELMYQDIVASLYERNTIPDLVASTARELFVPLTVGGGIRTAQDVRELLARGADRVAMNTAVVATPSLIGECAELFGTQCVTVALESIHLGGDKWEPLTDCGRNRTGLDTVTWARAAVDLGAGELLLTSVDRDGTFSGPDVDLLERVCSSVRVPVLAHGGITTSEHARQCWEAGASGVVIAAALHSGRIRLNELKSELSELGVPVRPFGGEGG